ncbi:MAG: hypothetical protein HQL31_04005 [Planctomycetes bacterium]|nr:hypothetical protein [Planctomycetota bacterium]
MDDYELFRLQLVSLGLRPKGGRDEQALYQRALELCGARIVDFDHPALAALWSELEAETLSLTWSEGEYRPERSLLKKAMEHAGEAVAALDGHYPTRIGEELREEWTHLFLHGKLGLLAALTVLEHEDSKATVSVIAPLIEGFMTAIEGEFQKLLQGRHLRAIAGSLRIKLSGGEDFESFIRGRLQPFSQARSLYLEDNFASMRPLTWWVVHEKVIPDLPQSVTGE